MDVLEFHHHLPRSELSTIEIRLGSRDEVLRAAELLMDLPRQQAARWKHPLKPHQRKVLFDRVNDLLGERDKAIGRAKPWAPPLTNLRSMFPEEEIQPAITDGFTVDDWRRLFRKAHSQALTH